MRGRLGVVYRGWTSYVIIRTGRTYIADLGEGDMKRVSAMELVCRGNWNTLLKHVGEEVSAKGKLMTDDASPYFWNGVRLEADSVLLADGSSLHPVDTKEQPLPVDMPAYLVTVTMLPRHALWPVHTVSLPEGKFLPSGGGNGCSLNGGGDVLNCFCADGFYPIRAGIVNRALPPQRWREIPEAFYPSGGAPPFAQNMAQFGLPDEDAKHPLTYQVVCKRK